MKNRFYNKTPDQWMADQRDKLIREGDLYRTAEGMYRLTIQGEEKILELLMGLAGEPGNLLLLEQWYAERLETEGPFSNIHKTLPHQ
ncbi:hypothetical protein [Paenibacillus mesotrionivorans]|uniref:Uncharacterized protein n=1 Tax=Paenibacillus mesotrionivorans TaxID=3160968 RepID=A0ACC7P199_9BACL